MRTEGKTDVLVLLLVLFSLLLLLIVAVFNFARAHDFQSNLKHITSLPRLGYQSGFHFGLNFSTLIDNKKEILIPENTKLSI